MRRARYRPLRRHHLKSYRRRLHRNLDFAVRDAYGWHDIELDHGFHNVRGAGIRYTFAPEAGDEILERLLELNRDRYLAEVEAGLHANAKKKNAAPLGGLFEQVANPKPHEQSLYG